MAYKPHLAIANSELHALSVFQRYLPTLRPHTVTSVIHARDRQALSNHNHDTLPSMDPRQFQIDSTESINHQELRALYINI